MRFGYGYGMNRYGYGYQYGLAPVAGKGHTSGVVTDPLAAHVAAMQGIDPSGKYILADPAHYTASLSQAGVFSDAFGSSFLYSAPNVQASPTATQDPASGLWYVSSDGADDTALGSAPETVAAYTAVFRSPPGQTTWPSFGALIGDVTNIGKRLPYCNLDSTNFAENGAPFRKNGVALASADASVSPITNWMVLTFRSAYTQVAQTLQLCAMEANFARLHLAALRTWPTDPSASVVQQTEAEMARYFAPLIATNP